MDNRELLEKAAKAAGLLIGFGARYPDRHVDAYVWNPDGKTSRWWNPLTDDGDALRLAVKLQAEPMFAKEYVRVVIVDDDGDDFVSAKEPYGNDAMEATRRAIVRAAAAIGGATA